MGSNLLAESRPVIAFDFVHSYTLTKRDFRRITKLEFTPLGRKIEVETSFEAVQLKLARREESTGSFSRGLLDELLLLLGKLLLLRNKLLLLGNKLLLLGNKLLLSKSRLNLLDWSCRLDKASLLVRKVMGVDEWIDSSTVSASRNTAGCLGLLWGKLRLLWGKSRLLWRKLWLLWGKLWLLWGKLSSVDIVLEVAVGGIVGVDEGVEVGIHRGVFIVGVVKGLGNSSNGKAGLAKRGGLDWGGGGVVGVKGGGVLASGSYGDVISF